MDPKKMKKLMYAAMVSSSVLGYIKKAVVAAVTPEPRTCPVCGYRMVEKVRTVPVKAERKDGKATIEKLGYYQCGGCRERYKALADGPFTRPSDDEWRIFVLRQRF